MLDSFPAFTNSDMRNDKPLVALFKRCGCGHLFSLLDLEDEAAPDAKAGADRPRSSQDQGTRRPSPRRKRASSSKKTTPTRARIR